MHKFILCFITALLCFTHSFPQNNQIEKKLDILLTKEFSRTQPGCVVLIAKHGQVLYEKAFGSANLELSVSMKSNMVFNVGSITKQFTAVAILQLAEENKLSLQDSLQKFIHNFPSKGSTITIENLLTHTSGIKSYEEIDHTSQNIERWDFTPEQLIDNFKNYPLNFEPGTQFSYSNSGYYLLGYIIEKISGKPYQKYIQDKIFNPLGLKCSYFDDGKTIIPKRVNGYYRDDSAFKNAEYWSPTIEYAHGGLISNAEDILKWHNALYSYKILGKEILQKATTPYKLKDGTLSEYGYGWFIRTASDGVKSIEHEGGVSGFLANEIYFPQQDIFIVILCNSQDVPIEDLSAKVSNIILGK